MFRSPTAVVWTLAALLPLIHAEDVFWMITPDRMLEDGCLSNNYYGSYGRPLKHVYSAGEDCIAETTKTLNSASIILTSKFTGSRLVWLQDAGVDESIRGDSPSFDTQINGLWKQRHMLRVSEPNSMELEDKDSQFVVGSVNENLDGLTVYRDRSSAVISVPETFLPQLDTILPRFVVPVVLPATPLSNTPVSKDAIKRLQHILSKLSFNPSIASILSHLNTLTIRKDVGHLTGEGGSGLVSRHSFTDGAKEAANWIQGEIEKSGATCEQRKFLTGFSPNVICRYPASVNTTATTILSAHYDSRGSFGSLRAPGGDDDGSGTAHLLAVARVIGQRNISFHHNFELVAFAGEEQGLLGSKAYAGELRAKDANVTLHIQADMLAYRSPSEPPQLGLPEFIGLPEAAHLVANISKIYAPELTVGYTTACCSDHQSFHEQGFPATQVFERAGPIIDPMYHNSGDISNRTGYDFEQLKSITKVTFATILEVVGFDYEEIEAMT